MKNVAWKQVKSPFVLIKDQHNLHLKSKFLKQADFIGYVSAKLSKYVKI